MSECVSSRLEVEQPESLLECEAVETIIFLTDEDGNFLTDEDGNFLTF